MTSPLAYALTHRGLWIAVGMGIAALAALRQAERQRKRRRQQVEARSRVDRAEQWAELATLRAEEQLFERFRSLVEARLEVDVLDLLPDDEVGEVLETGRALRRLIHECEGEFDCALPATGTTQRMTLEDWFRIIARNASRRTRAGQS